MTTDENVLSVELPEMPRGKKKSNPLQTKHCSKTKHLFPEEEEDNSKRWRKDYHNAIEKRRRDQINSYIEDLQTMLLEEKVVVPNCDKVTTLSSAIDYLKSYHSHPSTAFPISSFVKSEFTNLFARLDAAFVLTFSCSDLKILYVNEGVNAVLGMPPSLLVGQKLTNFINPGEVEDFETEHRGRLIKWNNGSSQQGDECNSSFVINMIANDLNTGCQNLLPILFSGEFKMLSIPYPNSIEVNAAVLCFSGALKSLI